MTQALFDVVFHGEVLAGFSRDEVKQAFARSFKLSDSKVEQIFSGNCYCLRAAQEEMPARDYLRRLERLGARADLEPSPAGVVAPALDSGVIATGEPSTEQAHGFCFHGSGGEYFRIWIVNILLTIATLGIYSAWAKVRTRQYFYGNTELDGSRFTYLANPVAILKGRVLALALVVAYVVGTSTPLWWVSALAVLMAILMIPFFVQRALTFNARYSEWRNLRFDFDGSFRIAMLIFTGLPLSALILIGVTAETINLWTTSVGWLVAPMLLVLVMGVPYFLYRQNRYWVSHSMYGSRHFQFGADSSQFLRLWLKLLLCAAAAALLAGLALALKGALTATSMVGPGGEDSSAGTVLVLPLVLLVYAVMGLCYLLPLICFSVGANNLVYNNTRLGDFRLQANYELGSYGKLVLVNVLLTLLSLGLYRPFAMVRTARYRAAHTRLLAAASLAAFVAREQEQVGAQGEFHELDFGV
ncbi:DUF898 family protein [Pseudomaricurvus sp. HS19]|uniref:DUF898 family protein n=1 Tax=Pseudomaricurvus sp. HS19 TaxID=2692626 RepID=UPI00136923C9|nr:DUF898 family protein [Pseudomaricurvus sp. HS19]MYM63208.1 DUF898 family protein [Pseudomaricurvus sp. HS19]